MLIVAIGGGGTDLADRDEGVSVGLIEIVNGLRRGALAVGIPTNLILTTAAIEAADSPQARLEQWLAADLARRLDQAPCMRAILIGHSHGAVVVTTVTAALEDRYGPRLLGVLLDRSLLYYDRLAEELPDHAAVLNVYQLNEGWHGEPLLLSNVTNVDESAETAPLEPRDGPEPVVAVAHSTLDDSPGIQARVVERVLLWMVGGRLVR